MCLPLDLGVDFKSRLKSTWEFGVGSGRFHLGSESNFSGVICLFSSRFFNIRLFFAALGARSQMNESLFLCPHDRVRSQNNMDKTTKNNNTNTEISFLNVFYSVVFLNMLSVKKNIYFKTNSHH